MNGVDGLYLMAFVSQSVLVGSWWAFADTLIQDVVGHASETSGRSNSQIASGTWHFALPFALTIMAKKRYRNTFSGLSKPFKLDLNIVLF